ncbi:MAG: hypothetical protein HQ538_01990 [Parcubacteria group bacterium]|nr:hypothetical protein [Parcubacteria group bacterium]
MTDEKWEEVKNMAREKFGMKDEFEEELEGGGSVEIIEFEGPLGLMKVERTVKPKVLDTKTSYSNRKGATASSVEHVTSKTEEVKFVKAYVKKDERWVEMEMPL